MGIEFLVEPGEGVVEFAGCVGVGEVCESWSDDPVVGPGEEHGCRHSERCGLVSVGVGYPFDEAVESESSQVVGGLSAGHGAGLLAQ